MEELKLAKNKDLKRKLGYAAKSAVKAGLRKASPYVQKVLAFMMLCSAGNISAEEINKYSGYDNGNRTEYKISDAKKSVEQGDDAVKMKDLFKVVFKTFEECKAYCNNDFNLDISQMEFSMADLELAKGKESDIAKEMWEKALGIGTPAGYCTRNTKMTFRAMGWVDELSSEDRTYFESIASAWKLIPLLSAGKIGPLTEINIKAAELKSKTTPIPLLRVNEQGETKDAHTQFMWDKGAVFGAKKVQDSPERHKIRKGRKCYYQQYGKAHFYGDKETIEAVVKEVTKNRDDVLLVLNTETKTASVIALDNVPQDYRIVIAQYRTKKQPPVLDKIQPVELAVSAQPSLKMPENIKLMSLDNKVTSYSKRGGLSNG